MFVFVAGFSFVFFFGLCFADNGQSKWEEGWLRRRRIYHTKSWVLSCLVIFMVGHPLFTFPFALNLTPKRNRRSLLSVRGPIFNRWFGGCLWIAYAPEKWVISIVQKFHYFRVWYHVIDKRTCATINQSTNSDEIYCCELLWWIKASISLSFERLTLIGHRMGLSVVVGCGVY